MKLHLKNPSEPDPHYPIDNDLFKGSILDRIFLDNDEKSYLLPQAFPEGSPLHPSYPAGHATVSGACVTILKAFFDDSYIFPNPVIPDPTLDSNHAMSGTRLVHYNGSDKNEMTVGRELNK